MDYVDPYDDAPKGKKHQMLAREITSDELYVMFNAKIIICINKNDILNGCTFLDIESLLTLKIL